MSGKITDAELLAVVARNELRAIAATEGHDVVPTEAELEGYLAELGPEENLFLNRHLNDRSVSGDIAGLFTRERK